MKFGGWHKQALPHSAVCMNSQHGHVGAAVVTPLAAGVAFSTVQVGLDTASIPDAHIAHSLTHSQHFDPQFMPENTRIVKERLATMECMIIRPAETDTVDSDQCFPGARSRWLEGIVTGEYSWFVQ